MKLIIAGGRDFHGSQKAIKALDYFFLKRFDKVTEVVSGAARGADKFGEDWANANSIPIKRFIANWGLHGKQAGPIRNEQMASYADAVVLFPGGKGTANMKSIARKYNLIIYDWREDFDY